MGSVTYPSKNWCVNRGADEGTGCQCRQKRSIFSEGLYSRWLLKRNFNDFPSSEKSQFYSVETFLTTAAFLFTSCPLATPPPFPAATLPQALFKNRLSCMKKHHNVILVLSAHLPSRHLQKTVDESSVSPGPTEVAHFLLRHPHLGLARRDPNGAIRPDQNCSLGKVSTPLPLPVIRLSSLDKCSRRSVLRTQGNLWGYYGSFGR